VRDTRKRWSRSRQPEHTGGAKNQAPDRATHKHVALRTTLCIIRPRVARPADQYFSGTNFRPLREAWSL
jgi:hypothetical protein